MLPTLLVCSKKLQPNSRGDISYVPAAQPGLMRSAVPPPAAAAQGYLAHPPAGGTFEEIFKLLLQHLHGLEVTAISRAAGLPLWHSTGDLRFVQREVDSCGCLSLYRSSLIRFACTGHQGLKPGAKLTQGVGTGSVNVQAAFQRERTSKWTSVSW
jgi:hypothetical protein